MSKTPASCFWNVADVVPIGDVDVVIDEQGLDRRAQQRREMPRHRRDDEHARLRTSACPCGNGAGCRTASAATTSSCTATRLVADQDRLDDVSGPLRRHAPRDERVELRGKRQERLRMSPARADATWSPSRRRRGASGRASPTAPRRPDRSFCLRRAQARLRRALGGMQHASHGSLAIAVCCGPSGRR